jgi:hypothetical protein
LERPAALTAGPAAGRSSGAGRWTRTPGSRPGYRRQSARRPGRRGGEGRGCRGAGCRWSLEGGGRRAGAGCSIRGRRIGDGWQGRWAMGDGWGRAMSPLTPSIAGRAPTEHVCTRNSPKPSPPTIAGHPAGHYR